MVEFVSAKKAVFQIKNNSLLVFSGMQLNRPPMKLVYEIIRQNYTAKNKFKIIGTPNPVAMDLLIAAGIISETEFAFMGFRYEYGFVIPKYFRKAVMEKKIKYIESPAYSLIRGLKAGAENIDFIEVKNLKGTDLLNINNPNLKIKKDIVLRKAIKPDFALVHAQYADKKGNVFIEDPLNEELLAAASEKVIVSVEKIKDNIKPTLGSDLIDYIVEIPKGAYPCSCYKFYNYDKEIIKEYNELAFEDYYNKYIKN
ncbi:hypothetical protein JXB41_00505 [Candidatus Woesearchaeota archaeon]|nr:hypothetical protein [Candidatus Woesearchaeota archaeon]